MTATRLSILDLPEGNAMRHRAKRRLMGLEIASMRWAEKLGSIDPVPHPHDTQVDPEKPGGLFPIVL